MRSLRGVSSVEHQHTPGHELRIIAGEEQNAPRDLVRLREPPDHLIGRKVGELRYAVYGARGMEAAGSSTFDGLPWLGFDDSMAYLAIARWQRAQSVSTPARVRFGSLASMLQAAAEGLGVAILPLFAADQHTALSRHLAREIPRALAARQRVEL